MKNMSPFDFGETYFRTDSKKGPNWWDGTKWIEYDGAVTDVNRSGTYANRPTTGIYVGFRYFCTSGAKVAGVPMSNFEIYYTGNGWVDALGRTVTS